MLKMYLDKEIYLNKLKDPIEKLKEPLSKLKKPLKKLREPKNIIISGGIILVMSLAFFAFLQITAPYALMEDGTKVKHPWVIKVGDKETFLVADENQGKKIVKDLIKTYYKEPAAAKAATISPKIKIVEKDLPRGEEPPSITSNEDAVALIVETNKTDKPLVRVTTTQQVTEKKAIKYKVKVKKTKALFKGEKQVQKKGKKGKGTVISQVIWENGEVASETVMETIVEKKPVSAIIKKGTKPMKPGDLSKAKNGGTIMGKGSGQDVVNYALKFVGNPYKYGGSSLTHGTDCSGFTMSVYAHFGISLPHSSYAQRSCGKSVSYSNAKPGDIICYAGHVALYIGGGKIVHASTSRTGIIIGNAKYKTILSVRRIVE